MLSHSDTICLDSLYLMLTLQPTFYVAQAGQLRDTLSFSYHGHLLMPNLNWGQAVSTQFKPVVKQKVTLLIRTV